MPMTDVIHLLPDSVANQIAAGEVIQRPASVVKELVENSIDAGATAVQIIIKDAGRTLIQVIDNGCGMSVTDARMAFERHATSKIQDASDLFALHTMGFRGEALPSIAAVSEIELRSMRAGDVAGTRLIISASKVESQTPDVCQGGTNIMVKRLFFNLPARRKFLKKDAVELGHITREFERLALVNTGVEFTLTSNDAVVRKLLPASFKQRICDLFSPKLDHQIIPVSTETSLVRIDGYVSLPQFAKRRGQLQYFFVNGRNMRHPYFHKAVLGCFESLIPADTQPSYFINLTVDPETIDVNIHPQKYEVKFENEQPIWQILSACVKEALGRYNASAAIDFDTVDAPDIPAYNPGDKPAGLPDFDVDLHYNPFKEDRAPRQHYTPSTSIKASAPTDWEKLYAGFAEKLSQDDADPDTESAEMPVAVEPEQPQLFTAESEKPAMLQIKGRYIAMPSKNGLMLIDQHRAHTRVLFEKYSAQAQQGMPVSQRLIFPDSVQLDPSQDVICSSICDMLCSMGFDISNLGGSDWSINAVPAIIGQTSPSEALLRIINAMADEEADVEQSQWQRIASAMARSGAIKYGESLTPEEMDAIVTALFRLSTPDYTPDGKPVIRVIDIEDIHKMF